MILFDAMVAQETSARVRADAIRLINEAVEAGVLPIPRCPLLQPKR